MRTLLTTIPLIGLLAWSPLAGAFEKTIPVKGKADVTVGTKSGDVKIVGWNKSEVKVEADDDIGKFVLVDGDTIRIGANEDGKIVRHITADMTVYVPAGSSVNAITISGDLSLEKASGRFKVKTISGDLSVRTCSGHLSANSTSGRCTNVLSTGSWNHPRVLYASTPPTCTSKPFFCNRSAYSCANR